MALPIAWYSVRNYSSSALHAQSRGMTASRSAQRLRHAFLVTQIALSFVLLAGAGLLAASLMNLSRVAPGFQPAHVLSGQVSLPWARYSAAADRQIFIDRLMDALRAQPGVAAAGASTNIPLSGNSNRSAATVKGFVLPPGESIRANYSYAVAGDYFAAMRIPVVSGRPLTADDVRLGNRVCAVDQDFARRYWPDANAIGHKLFLGSEEGPDTEAYTVVGVVGAVKQAALSEQEALGAVYYPYEERFDNAIYIVTRTSQEPDAFARTLQRAVRTIDAELPVNNIRSMDTRIADSLITRRSPAVLALLYAIIALLLTAIGTYGVLGYAVAQRRREIAVRMALGARPDQVRRQFIALASRLIAGGSVIGVAGAWMTGRAMQALLFEVPPLPVTILGLTAAVLGTVCLAACLLPSWRAARISPRAALAEE
jgi:predicted permease